MAFLRRYIFIILTITGAAFLFLQLLMKGPIALSGVVDTTFRNPGRDFNSLYYGGRRMLVGDNLYFTEKQLLKTTEETPGAFVYPPLMAEIFVPISSIPLKQSYLVFDILSFGILFLVLYKFSSKEVLDDRRFFIVSFLVLILSPILILHLERGQTDILVMSMIYMSFVAFLREKSIWSGFWVGVAASLKVTPLIFLPYFFLKDKKAFLSSLATIILFSIFFRFEIWVDFLRKLKIFSGGFSSGIASNSLFGIFHNHYTEYYLSASSLHLTLLSVVALLLILIFTFIFLVRNSRDYILREYGILSSLIIIIPSVAWLYNGVYSIFILAAYWIIRSKESLNKWTYFVFDILAYILLSQPIMSTLLREFAIYHIFSLRPIIYLLFIVLIMRETMRDYFSKNNSNPDGAHYNSLLKFSNKL